MPGFNAAASVIDTDDKEILAEYLDEFFEESDLSKKVGSGYGGVGIFAMAEALGVVVKVRVNFTDAPDNDGFHKYTPKNIAPEFDGTTLYFYHTGYFHWKAGVKVRGQPTPLHAWAGARRQRRKLCGPLPLARHK